MQSCTGVVEGMNECAKGPEELENVAKYLNLKCDEKQRVIQENIEWISDSTEESVRGRKKCQEDL